MRTLADLIGYALERAPQESDKAEDVLQFFCDVVEAHRTPDERILTYLAGCFQRIIDAAVLPASALNLSGSQGKRRKRTLEKQDERDLHLASDVVRRMETGQKCDAAIADVAAAAGVSVSVVKRAYEAHHATIQAMRDFDIVSLSHVLRDVTLRLRACKPR